LIELAAVTGGSGVDGAVASVFMLQPQPGRTWRQVVVDGLQGRDVLLVVDNCEHVLDDVAGLVEALAACPTVRVLVTSRESLAVSGEWAWRVPSLTGAAAVELFIERADTAASEFAPDDADLAVIGEICERLDGIALAIELAASRVRSMSPTQIRDRLDERLRLLTGSRRSIERHQTLRHAVQWSYDLLEPVEQAVLRQVSVFVGGFGLDAAAAVTELDEYDVLDILDSLVRKSLLYVDRTHVDVRYGILETIRQFAEEALASTGTSDATRDRHAHYYADQSDLAFARYVTVDELLAHRWVDTEISNIAAAFDWSLARGTVDDALRLAARSHHIAHSQMRTETYTWPERVLDLARASEHRQLPLLLAAACDAAQGSGRWDDAPSFGLEAIALNDDDRYDFDPFAYYVTAVSLSTVGEVDQALQVVRLGAEHPSDTPLRINLLFLHTLCHVNGVPIAEQEGIQAIAHLRRSPMPVVRAGSFQIEANLAAPRDASAAIALYQEAIDGAADCGARLMEEYCRSLQVGLIAQTDDLEAALTGFARAASVYQSSMGDSYAAEGLAAPVTWLARHGYHDGAARLLGAALRGRPGGWPAAPPEVVALPEVMGEAEFTAAFGAGAALDPRAVAELAHQLIAQVRADHLDA
jgi:predicted ATPase